MPEMIDEQLLSPRPHPCQISEIFALSQPFAEYVELYCADLFSGEITFV
jgi:hypothetical protein